MKIFLRTLIFFITILIISFYSANPVLCERFEELSKEEREILGYKNALKSSLDKIEKLKSHMEMADLAKNYSSALALIHHKLGLNVVSREGLRQFYTPEDEIPYKKHCPELLAEYKKQLASIDKFKEKIETERIDLLHFAQQESRTHLCFCRLYLRAINKDSREFKFDDFRNIVDLFQQSGQYDKALKFARHALLCADKKIQPVEFFGIIPDALILAYDYDFKKEAYEIAARELKEYQEQTVKTEYPQIETLIGLGKFYAHANDLKNTLHVNDIANTYFQKERACYLLYSAIQEFLYIQNIDASIECAKIIYKENIKVAALEDIFKLLKANNYNLLSEKNIEQIKGIADNCVYSSSRLRVHMKIAEWLFGNNKIDECRDIVFESLSIDDPSNPPSFNLNDLSYMIPPLVNSGFKELASSLVDKYYIDEYTKHKSISQDISTLFILASLYTLLGNDEKAFDIINSYTGHDYPYRRSTDSLFYLSDNIDNSIQILVESKNNELVGQKFPSLGRYFFFHFIRNQQPDYALKYLDSRSFSYDENKEKFSLLIECYFDLKQPEKAINLFESKSKEKEQQYDASEFPVLIAREYMAIGDIDSAINYFSQDRLSYPNISKYMNLISNGKNIITLSGEKQKVIYNYITDSALEILYQESTKNVPKPSTSGYGGNELYTQLAQEAETDFLDFISYINRHPNNRLSSFEKLAPFYSRENLTSEFIPIIEKELERITQDKSEYSKRDDLLSIANIYIAFKMEKKAIEIIDVVNEEAKSRIEKYLVTKDIIDIYKAYINAGRIDRAEKVIKDVQQSGNYFKPDPDYPYNASILGYFDTINEQYSEAYKKLQIASRWCEDDIIDLAAKELLEKGEFEWALKIACLSTSAYPIVNVLEYFKEKNIEYDLDKYLIPHLEYRMSSPHMSNKRDALTEVATIYGIYGSKEKSLEILMRAFDPVNNVKGNSQDIHSKQEVYEAFAKMGFITEIKKLDTDSKIINTDHFRYCEVSGHLINRNYDLALKMLDDIEHIEFKRKAYQAAISYHIMEGLYEKAFDLLDSLEDNYRTVSYQKQSIGAYYWHPGNIDMTIKSIKKLIDEKLYVQALRLLSCYAVSTQTTELLIYMHSRMTERAEKPGEEIFTCLKKMIHSDDYFVKYSYSEERSKSN